MGYQLGVDLGTTYTAAAVRFDGRVEVVQLGTRRPEIPSLVYLKTPGDVLVGEAAERRGALDPASLAREFKRRIGDKVPLWVGGQGYAAEDLMKLLLAGVLATVSRQQEGPPGRVSVTCPANWGPYRRGLLESAVRDTAKADVELHVEPEAAAIQFSSSERVQPGEAVAVYDLGGGTFDAAVLRKTESGFELLGEPAGVEELGGMDFDEAVLGHVMEHVGPHVAELDPQDATVIEALVRLRRECVEAKEALSSDTDVTIPVTLPSMHTSVRITRSEFEDMVGPSLTRTVEAMDRAIGSAQVAPESLRAVLLTGGSSRIPLVSSMLSERYGRPLVMDPQPEHSIALGAARAAGGPGRVRTTAPANDSGSREPRVTGNGPPSGPTSPDGADELEVGPARGRRGWWQVGSAALAALALIGVVWWTAGTGPDPGPGPRGAGAAEAGTWKRLADLPVSLEAAAVAEHQGKLWVAGGLKDDDDRTKLTTVYIYDPGSDSWSTGPSMPTPISHGSLVSTNEGLYFLGGWVQDGGSARVLKLDATNTAWSDDVPLPEARIGGAAAWDGSHLIYAGGNAAGGVATDTVWSLSGSRWVTIDRLSMPRHKAAVISNDVDSIWILGGRNQQTGEKFENIDVVHQGRVDAYSEASVTPPVDGGVGLRLVGIGLCVLGGEIDGGYNDWWCENTEAANELPRLDPPRAGLGGAWIGDTFYVVGGFNTSAAGGAFEGTDRLEAYTPEG